MPDSDPEVGPTIVVGLDGSDESMRTLGWAAAAFPAGRLVAVNGFPGEDRFAVRIRPDADALRADHERLLATEWVAAGEGHPGLDTMLVDGDGATAVLSVANEFDADLVVVGHKGRSAWSEDSIGSVVGRVLARADRPVVITSPGVAAQAPSAAIVVAVSRFEAAPSLVAWGARMARTWSLALQLVHVVEPLPYVGEAVDLAPIRSVGEGSLADIAEAIGAEHGDLEVSSEVLEGEALACLADVSARAGLVIVGSRPVGRGRGRAMGSIASHLPALASCPVVAVPLEE